MRYLYCLLDYPARFQRRISYLKSNIVTSVVSLEVGNWHILLPVISINCANFLGKHALQSHTAPFLPQPPTVKLTEIPELISENFINLIIT